ncbi:MAG: methyltransferase domain-containing protein [Acidimicrobiales bacterium]
MTEAAAPCRSCGTTDLRSFLSLGTTPLADALLPDEEAFAIEPRYPLDVAFCPHCSLVQILEEVPPEKLFVENYLYFSSFSDELLRHNREHALGLVNLVGLDSSSLVMEVASNDGYFLKNFVELGIPVLGIDPAPGQADAAEAAGVPTLREFFGAEMAARLRADGRRADAIVANNVMAHVPDLNGFVAGYRTLISDHGLITVENPYVRDLIDHCEFDTIYHEHHCYFSCTAVDTLVRRHGLFLNHVEHFPDLHGGTLRWHIGPVADVSETVREYLRAEAEVGLTDYSYYAGFAKRVEQIRTDLRSLLQRLRDDGATIAAYGAAAKGSTLVNYVGIGTDLVDFVVDRNMHKQGRYMPGAHIPIVDPAALLDKRPDYVLLLAWNFKDEIMRQQTEYRRQGGRFIVPVPTPEVV